MKLNVLTVLIAIFVALLVAGCIENEKNYNETSVNVSLEVGRSVSISNIFNITTEDHTLLVTDTQYEANKHPFCMGICSDYRVGYIQHIWMKPRLGVHTENENVTGTDKWYFSGYWKKGEKQEKSISIGQKNVLYVKIKNVNVSAGTVSSELVFRRYD